MSNTEILVEKRGQAMLVSLNRPDHRNAMTMDMATQLFNLLKSATTDHSVRLVVLKGSGGNYMDGVEMSSYAADINAALERANQLILPYHSAIRELQTMDKPVLSVVEGCAAGAGLSLVLSSDLVIAAETATFCTKFSESAMSPDGGCSTFLPRKVGMGRAIELLMLSPTIGANEAMQLGIVNRVVPADTLNAAADEMIERLVSGPTKSYGAIKKLVSKAYEQDLHAQLGLEHTYFGHNSRSFDFREAVRARAASRDPKFTGT